VKGVEITGTLGEAETKRNPKHKNREPEIYAKIRNAQCKEMCESAVSESL
jgi:hypothetical protein